jgi:hypothetical protein
MTEQFYADEGGEHPTVGVDHLFTDEENIIPLAYL